MKVHAQGFGKTIEPDALKPGELFVATADEGDALCLSFEAKDQQYALILRTGTAEAGLGTTPLYTIVAVCAPPEQDIPVGGANVRYRAARQLFTPTQS